MSGLSLSTRLACMAFASLAAAGCLVEGTVRDAATGEPIAGATVGTYPWLDCRPSFESRVVTDEDGHYRFTVTKPRQAVMARATDYAERYSTLNFGAPRQTRDLDLPYIAGVQGEWDVVLTFDAGSVQDGNIFGITQEGLELISACGFSEEVDFDFDGTEVIVEGQMGMVGACDVVSGMMEFHLTLDDRGNTLTGPFSFWGSCFSECLGSPDGRCRGTLVATRRVSR